MAEISVISPCLNQARFLADAVRSVRGQLAEGVEQWIVDGGSRDGSRDVWQKVRGEPGAGPAPVHWLDADSHNPAEAFNRGLLAAQGSLIGWLPADDTYAPGALARVRDFFAAHPDVDVVYGSYRTLDEAGQPGRTIRAARWNRARLRRECLPCLPAVFFRRRVVDRFGLLDPHLDCWEDYDYWLRLSEGGAVFARLAQVLGCRRWRLDGRRFGNPTPAAWLRAAEERARIQARQTGRVCTDAVVDLAYAQAELEGLSRLESAGYDRQIADRIRQLDRQWNPGPRQATGCRLDQLGKQLAAETRELLRRPRLALRFLPSFVRRGGQNFLRRKVFTLRHQDPRPLVVPSDYETLPCPPNPPRISIVTPNLNQGPYLAATLRSVLDQNYPRLEYLVQDGGSTDGSLEILRQFADRLTGWVSEPDRGQADAINRGMRRTRGQIMAYLNSDDLLLPGSLAYVADYFERHPEVDVVYGHRILIDEQGRQIGRWILPPHDDRAIAWSDYIPQETMFWRRRAWDQVGGCLDESFQFALDWDLILRFRAAGLRFVRLPRFLGAFRVTGEQKTTQLIQTVGAREMARLRQRTLGHNPASGAIRRRMRPYLVRHVWYDTAYALGLVKY